MKQRKLHTISLFLFFIIITGCEDRYTSSIPNYPVFLELNLTAHYPTFIDNCNEVIIITKPISIYDRIGYGGILIVYGIDFKYYAFDLSCPYEADPNIRVFSDSINPGQVTCEKCGSSYEILHGTEGRLKVLLTSS